ncbi:MAG: insulinase family protein [Alkaliphilus sp.]|nr:insulinase family protein [Alkaliphilus sp.]
MLDRILPINIGNGVTLHLINTKKFKTSLVSVYLQRPLTQEEVTKNALISMILPRGTKRLETSKDIAKYLENLYGTSIGSNVSKKGERNIINFRMQVINEIYIDEKHILEKGIRTLNEFINDPLIEQGHFKTEYLNQERANLTEKIEGRKNDKMKYAYERCIEEMCKNEAFSLYEYGNVKDLKEISDITLFMHYENLLKSSPVDICVVGDISNIDIQKMIDRNMKFKINKPIAVEREKLFNKSEKVKNVAEEMDISQGKLVIGYRTNIPFESELYEPLIVYSNILGGGPNSKLFKNLREKESLCYYIFSRIEKFKSLMLISSGIEFDNFDKTVDLVGMQIKDMNNGNISSEEIESAKNAIITAIRSMTDSPGMLADFYYTQIISNNQDNMEEIINKIRKVNKETIVEAGKNIKIDTIYFLRDKKEDN